jgi:CO/xanthine dehydrogenase FAD-binding subunit
MSVTWFSPSTLAEALDYLDLNPQAKPIAGGTDLLVKNYDKLDMLPGLMGLGKLQELKMIQIGEDVKIGALVTHHQIAEHPWLQQHTPILCQGAQQVGAPQIRHRGTIGGNIANASPAADTVPPLIALGASVELASRRLTRTVALEQFFTGPGRTVMEPGEIITAIKFPRPGKNQGGCYLKLGKRKAMAIATGSIAVFVTASSDKAKLDDIRICLGSVGPTPLRAVKTEAVLRGGRLGSLPLDRAKTQVAAEITPIDDIRGTAQYRRDSSMAILERALIQAIIQAGVNLG